MRTTIESGSPYEAMAGYSRAVVDGDWIFVSGTAGYNFKTKTISDDAVEQAKQSLATIGEALEKAGAGLGDIVRLVVYLSDREWIFPVSDLLRQTFPERQVTNTTVICTLTMPEMKVEIEATALKRQA